MIGVLNQTTEWQEQHIESLNGRLVAFQYMAATKHRAAAS